MSYQAAQNLRKELSNVGIKETWIGINQVDIQCLKHELKKTLRVINLLKDSLSTVSFTISVKNRHGVFERKSVVRIDGQPIKAR